MRGNRTVYGWTLEVVFSAILMVAFTVATYRTSPIWEIAISAIFWCFYHMFTWIIINSDMKWWQADVLAIKQLQAYVKATQEDARNEVKEL